MVVEGQGQVTLDFSEIDGLTPSFFDEMLRIIEESIPSETLNQFNVTMKNPPTQLSSKFVAVGKGHGLDITELDNGSWVIAKQ